MTTQRSTSNLISFIATLLRGVRHQMGEASIRRARRIALADLLRLPDARLDELGINRQDIIEAFDARQSATGNSAPLSHRTCPQGNVALGAEL
jgi:hypothetical protein